MCKSCKKVKKYLPETHPWLVEDWDFDKNGDLRPEDVTYGSGKRVWWIHGEDKPCGGNSWVSAVYCRTGKKPTGCPACCGRVVTDKNKLSTTHPELAKQWDKKRNGDLGPDDVTQGSNKKVWWIHGKDKPCGGYRWLSVVNDRTSGRGCPACAGKVVTDKNSLAAVSPEVAKQWDKDRNGSLTPEMIMNSSNKAVWWKHGKDKKCGGHSWKAVVSNRTYRDGPTGCPACVNYVVTDKNNLGVNCPTLVEEFDLEKNGGKTAFDFVAGSHKKVWWIHGKDKPCGGYSWKALISDRTGNKCGCPACANRVATGTNNLEVRFPGIAKEMDEVKTGFGPKDVTYGSEKKVYWKCDKGHSWKSSVCNRTSKTHRGCPYCANSGISKSSQKWLDTLNIEIREYYIKDLKIRVDGFDTQTNTVYEFLGDYWHGNPSSKKYTPLDMNLQTKKSFGKLHQEWLDRKLMLENNGYKVVYVWEMDYNKGKMESVE